MDYEFYKAFVGLLSTVNAMRTDQLKQGKQLDEMMTILNSITQKETALMATMQEVQQQANDELAAITAETDVVNAVKMVVDNQLTKLTDLQAQIDALLATGATPAAMQALSDTLTQIRTVDTANAAIVAAAVAAGTPVQPPVEPPAPDNP